MTRRYFVTGTDTEIGKTYVACELARQWQEEGHSVACCKPVASDAVRLDGKLVNDDAVRLQTAASVQRTLDQINPYCFEPAIAPHIAAREAGVEIELDVIKNSILDAAADIVLIEGFGGWLAPVFQNGDETLWQSDIASAVDADIILVVGMRLGCLNHTLLSARQIEQEGFRVAGWVANVIDPDMGYLQENIDTLKQQLTAPLLRSIEWNPDADAG